jgi:hypothetical protein
MIVGSPGLGKTDLVKAVAKQARFKLQVCHPVVDDPTDYKGLPAVASQDGRMSAQFLPFGDLRAMTETTENLLVFFDDLGQATPAVQAAIMQLVLARKINGHAISDNVTFVAATNRRQDKAAVTGLITPLLDRFITVLELSFDVEDWIQWYLQQDLPPVLAAFARFKPGLINQFEASRDMKKSPTPRSVTGVGRLVKLAGEQPGSYLDGVEVLSGAAGEGFANEFLAFYRTWMELPDRAEIYMNPTKVPVPSKPDVLYALMGSLAHGATKTTMEATMTYLERAPKEFAVLCVRDALSRDKSLRQSKAFIQWASANTAAFGLRKGS